MPACRDDWRLFAATSPSRASLRPPLKWAGGKRWQLLHKLVYVIAPLGILHFWWMRAGKHDFNKPIVFGLIVLALLGIRAWWARKAAARA